MPTETVSALVAKLYDPDGTYNRDLTSALGKSYQDRNSDVGSGTFTLRQSDPDAAEILPLSMVKYHLLGAERFGVRVGAEDAAYDDTDCTVTWSCIGLLGAILSDAIVLDESGGIRVNSLGQRWVGWMSSGYDDTVTGWINTLAASSFVWTDPDQSSARLGNPTDWPDPLAWWVHRGDIGGQFQLWRRSFTLADDEVLKLWASADEEFTVYFDGEKVLEVTDNNETGYTSSNATELGIVQSGTHHVAVEWRSKITPIIGDDFDGFILTIGTVDDTGAYATNVTRTDDSGDWRSYGAQWDDPRPGMSRGAIMAMLWGEAAARGCVGMTLATLGFDDDVDSAAQGWDDELNEAINLADQGLDKVFLALCEGVIDLGFDAATMTMHAWKRRGTDNRGSVALKRGVPGTVEIADGANVTDFTTSRNLQVVTDLYGQLADGTYTDVHDAAARTTYGGRIERGVSLGNTPVGTGQVQLTMLLSQLTEPEVGLNIGQALHGAIPYTDYTIGDTVTAPAHRTGTGPARVTSITAEQQEGADYANVYPGLMPDPT